MLLLVGCGDDSAVPDEDLMVVGTIHGIITDYNTNTRLDSIQMRTISSGKILSTMTDSLGYYSFVDLASGEYEITCYGDSTYAVGNYTAEIPMPHYDYFFREQTEEVLFQQNFHISVIMDINLFGLNAGLTGSVYTKIDNETTTLASGVSIIADFANYEISPDKYYTTTNTSGVFSFVNLPTLSSLLTIFFFFIFLLSFLNAGE